MLQSISSMKRRVALATCPQFPDLSDDDRPLIPELARLDVDAAPAVWSRPCDWSAFDAVVVRSTWYYWLEHERFARWLAGLEAGGAAVWNPVAVIRENMDKRYLRGLAQAGVPVVPTEWLAKEDPRTLAEVLESRGWTEAVVKPVVSGNAEWTFRIGRGRAGQAREALEPAWRLGPAMIQPFVPSILSEGEYSLLFFGGEFSHAVVKRAKSGDFRVQHEHGGTTAPAAVDRSWIALAESVLETVGADLLYARVDLAVLDGRPHLMELELTEPFLYFEHAPGSAARFARALARRLS